MSEKAKHTTDDASVNAGEDYLWLYDQVKAVPSNAQKSIEAGRLRGMTDVNPMWRIKTLTRMFGPAGIGWTFNETRREYITGANGEQAVIIDAELRYKDPHTGEWSQPVHGTGGNMIIAAEKNGLRLDDEAIKKAYTDAMSVACKALGIGADVYWKNDIDSKYTSIGKAPVIADVKLKAKHDEMKALVNAAITGKPKDEVSRIGTQIKAAVGTNKLSEITTGDDMDKVIAVLKKKEKN